MAEDISEIDYRAEFERLGTEAVRADVLHRRFAADKLAAARLWLEREDARRWLAERGERPPRLRPEWLRRWAGYIVTGIGVAYATARIVRLLRYGA